MKKQYRVFSALFILFILVILVSIYIARQTLIKTYQRPEKLQAKDISVYPKPPASSIGIKQRATAKEAKKPEAEVKEEMEFDVSQIPDSAFKEIEESQPQEVSSAQKLDTQPSAQELRELKTKGVIIY